MTRRVFATLIRALAGALALAMLPAAAQTPASQPPAVEANDPAMVVARVGDLEITNGDVATAYQDLPKEYRQMPMVVLYPQLLDQLINRKLMLLAGLEQKLDDDPEIRARVRDYEQFAIQRTYLDRYIEATITDEVLRAEYDTTIGAEEGKTQVKASHILLQSEDAARAVIATLDDGADFAQVARDKSTGPSASKGGDLGYFNREQMVAPFASAAFEMDEGEVTAEPVKTQFGWHVIKVTGRRTQPPPTFDDVRQDILDQLTRDALTAHMAELRKVTSVAKFNPDGTPMAQESAK